MGVKPGPESLRKAQFIFIKKKWEEILTTGKKHTKKVFFLMVEPQRPPPHTLVVQIFLPIFPLTKKTVVQGVSPLCVFPKV